MNVDNNEIGEEEEDDTFEDLAEVQEQERRRRSLAAAQRRNSRRRSSLIKPAVGHARRRSSIAQYLTTVQEIENVHAIAEKAKEDYGRLDHTSFTQVTEEQQKKTEKQKVEQFFENASYFRKLMYKFAESKTFSGFILIVILLNTAMLVTQTFDEIAVRAGSFRISKESFLSHSLRWSI